MKGFLVLLLCISVSHTYDKSKFASNGGFSDKLVPNSEIEGEIREAEDKL